MQRCRFCGESDLDIKNWPDGDYRVVCSTCGGCGPRFSPEKLTSEAGIQAAKNKALAAWNGRWKKAVGLLALLLALVVNAHAATATDTPTYTLTWTHSDTPTPTATPTPTPTDSCNSGVTHFWTLNDTLNDEVGGSPLTMVGTVPFVDSPAPWSPYTYWAGGASAWSSSDYLEDPNAANDINQVQGTIEGGFYFESGASNARIWAIDDGSASSPNSRWMLLYISGGELNCWANGNVITSATLSAATNYYYAVTWNSDGVTLYVGTNPASMTDAGSTSALPTGQTLSDIYIGYEDGGSFAGFIGPLVVSNVVQSTFPNPARYCTPTDTATYTITPTPTATLCTNPQAADAYAASIQSSGTFASTGPDGPLTEVGTIDFTTSDPSPPNSGAFSFGPFTASSTGANYLETSAAQNTQFSNLANGGVDFEWYPTSTSPGSTQTCFSWTDSYLGFTRIALNNGSSQPFFDSVGDENYSSVDITANAWNEITLLWNGQNFYFYVNGTLGYTGYAVGFHTGTVTNQCWGCDLESLPSNSYTMGGYLCQIHYLTACVLPPILDGCAVTPKPTTTPYPTYAPTPTPDATPQPTCNTSPPVTVVPEPVVTPQGGMTPGQTLAEPLLAFVSGDPSGQQIHFAYSAENTNNDTQWIDLVTAASLNPSANQGSPTGWNYAGTLVGNGVAGVTDNVHGYNQVNLTDSNVEGFWGDGANGNYYCAASTNYGYNFETSTVAVCIPESQFTDYHWYPNGQQVFCAAIAIDPANSDHSGATGKWWAIAEVDSDEQYGPFPSDLLWLCESTTGVTGTYALASPLPIMSALCGGAGIIAQGPRALTWNSAGYWDMWESITETGPIYHLTSPDLYNWTCDGSPSVTNSQNPPNQWTQPSGGTDQVADVSGGFLYGGYQWLAFSAVNNAENTAAAGLFYRAPYGSCVMPTYSPTATVTPTPNPSANIIHRTYWWWPN